MLEQPALIQSPFTGLTLIVGPALLTNASSVLAMSTINRMLRTRELMQELSVRSEAGGLSHNDAARLVHQVNRVEKQSVLFLAALRSIYVALAAFAGATLVTLIGTALAQFTRETVFTGLAGLGLVLGFVGVGGLISGSANLFQATRLSLISTHEEASRIRDRQA